MINQFTNVTLSYDNLESYIIRKEILKAVINVIPNLQGHILDSGCGSMPYKKIILENKNVNSYTGLDIETGLDYEGIKSDVLWDGNTMPFEAASFDVVISTEVLEHVPDPEKYLAEVRRVLKPGGIFFFTVPFLMSLHEVPNDYYRYTPYALDRIFKNAGFENIEIKALGGYNAAVGQMLGLWVNMHLWGKKKKAMRIILKPIIQFLYKKDKPPVNFNRSTMIVGLAGTVMKPI
ncbi:MAG TPA: methyltransferase domain-containing protein [Flavobacterium sp.]|jgi:ubiquinone/menaquinone biosynthesis C-methylase UbiE